MEAAEPGQGQTPGSVDGARHARAGTTVGAWHAGRTLALQRRRHRQLSTLLGALGAVSDQPVSVEADKIEPGDDGSCGRFLAGAPVVMWRPGHAAGPATG